MAQYGKPFYGMPYYGGMNAFSGDYETKQLFTEEPLNSTFNVNIKGYLPSVFYSSIAPEIIQHSGTWTWDATYGVLQTNTPSAELRGYITTDRVIIKYEQRSSGSDIINVEITTQIPGVADTVKTYSFSTYSTSIDTNAQYVIDNLEYGDQIIRIWVDSTNTSTEYFNFKGIDARIGDLIVETRAGMKDGTSWTAYTKGALTLTPVSGEVDTYTVSTISPNYAGKDMIQVRVLLASSDDTKAPRLDDLETIAGDSSNRTADGHWEANIDMAAVASSTYKTSSLSDADTTVNTGSTPVLSNAKGWTAANTITFDIVTGPALGTVSGSAAGITFTSTKDATVTTLYHVSGSDGSSFDLDITGAAVGDNWKFTVSSLTFSSVSSIDWVATVPNLTTLIVRSRSSTDGIAYGKLTVPYRKNVNRLRLKHGVTQGYVDMPYISPSSSSAQGSPFVRTLGWSSWSDTSFLPPDATDTSVRYVFMNTSKDEANSLYSIKNPMNVRDKNLSMLGTRDFYLRVRLSRRFDKSSPVVDFISLNSEMEYKEDKTTEAQEFSAVHNNNTGKGTVLDMSQLVYTVPSGAGNPTYHLIDQTGRPNDVTLYLDSEAALFDRTNQTTTLINHVWAETNRKEVGEPNGLTMHYQYGGGTVTYPGVTESEMGTIFTPSLDPSKKYRYYLIDGWPDEHHIVAEGDTLQNIADSWGHTLEEIQAENPNPLYDNQGNLVVGQKIAIPNKSRNSSVDLVWKSTSSDATEKSSHNAKLLGLSDLSSDLVQATVIIPSQEGEVAWRSAEKIYDGILNINDIKSNYKRKHIANENGIEIQYTVSAGETYASIAKKYGIEEIDLRIANDAIDGGEPTEGQQITVPAPISLPDIDARAIVSAQPYEINIVSNSVKKKDGMTLSETYVTSLPVEVQYKEVTITQELVTRGSVANGTDVLSKSMVTSVGTVESEDKITVYNIWDETLATGDFKLTNNSIDWSPSGSEPAAGAKYYVTYNCLVPDVITVTIDTTYQEEGGVDRIWRSPEVKEFEGTCYPGKDMRAELPAMSTWVGSSTPGVEDMEFVIEDNDLWVKTWVEQKDGKHYAIGSLQDRVPKDNWFPTIQTGYYYLAKDEYYLYSEPITIEPTNRQVPIAKNVFYGGGKIDGAAYLQEGSINLITNSGFDVASTRTTVFKKTFPKSDNTTVAGLGITN